MKLKKIKEWTLMKSESLYVASDEKFGEIVGLFLDQLGEAILAGDEDMAKWTVRDLQGCLRVRKAKLKESGQNG